MNKLFRLLKPHRWRLALALVYSALAAGFTALAALILQPIMDDLFQSYNKSAAGFKFGKFLHKFLDLSNPVVIPLLVLVVFLGKALFTFLSNYSMRALAQRIIKELREEFFSLLLRSPLPFHDRMHSGSISSKFFYEVDVLERSLSDGVIRMIRESLTVFALMVVIIVNNPGFFLIALAILPLAAVPVVIFGKKVKTLGERRQRSVGEISRRITEVLSNIRIVKTFAAEDYEEEKFKQVNERNFRDNIKFVKVWTLSSPFIEFVGGFVAAVLIYISARLIRQGIMTPGQFTTFIASVFYMYTPIRRLSGANNLLQEGGAALERIEEIMKEARKYRTLGGTYRPEKLRGEIEFCDVHFSYDGKREVLRGVNFHISPGETVALVGSSGEGKTTITQLILGFYEPQKGKVLIDGVEVSRYDLKWLRTQIGVVTQDILLFNETVAENIAYGSGALPMEKILRAAEVAHVHEFISELPRGYHTVLDEKGFNFSLGQRQRLSIARAIVKDPRILILDEATSSLDADSERKIQEALSKIVKGRTTIIIAHRLSTVKMAHRILVLHRGKIVEEGTHEELLKLGGIYSRLYRTQMEA